jgi:hypothetical protein
MREIKTRCCLVLPVAEFLDTWYAGKIPPHCTLVPWYDVPTVEVPVLIQEIKRIAAQSPRPVLTSATRVWFGKDHTTPAYKLAYNSQLVGMHHAVLDLIREQRWELLGGWVGCQYNPHVTDTRTYTFRPRSTCTPSHLLLIEQRGRKQRKKVLGRFPIGIESIEKS